MKRLRNTAGLTVAAVALGLLLLPTVAAAGEKDEQELKQLEAAKMTLDKAIQAAETASKGKAVAAYVANNDVIVFCEVGGKCMEVPVDIKKGTAGKATEATAKDEKGAHITKAKEIVKIMDESKQTLAKVIAAAEASVKGKAIAAKPSLSGEKLEYSIRIKAGEKWENVTVDGKTGIVLKNGAKKEGEKKSSTPPKK